jgi:hypothetical protein
MYLVSGKSFRVVIAQLISGGFNRWVSTLVSELVVNRFVSQSVREM